MKTDCICTNLRNAALSSSAFYDACLAPSGLKVTMFRLLRRIQAYPSISITALADIVLLDRSTLGRNLRVLERQGFVVFDTGLDGRSRIVDLTSKGHEVLVRAIPLWERAQIEMKSALGEDLDRILASLEHLPQLLPGSRGS